MSNSIIACSKNWFFSEPKSEKFKKINFIKITNKKDFSIKKIKEIDPDYIFLPHWSYIVSPHIYENWKCIGFHTAPLPYGRGGSPIQNLIKNKIKNSPVCAFEVNNKIDSGPIYDSYKISLSGNCEDILKRISKAVENMILNIIKNKPSPVMQRGRATYFKRRSPSDSLIGKNLKSKELYDHIRMLDSDEYPRAYMNYGKYKIEFSKAELKDSKVYAKVIFKQK